MQRGIRASRPSHTCVIELASLEAGSSTAALATRPATALLLAPLYALRQHAGPVRRATMLSPLSCEFLQTGHLSALSLLTLVWIEIAVLHPAALDGLGDTDPRRSHWREPRTYPADG